MKVKIDFSKPQDFGFSSEKVTHKLFTLTDEGGSFDIVDSGDKGDITDSEEPTEIFRGNYLRSKGPNDWTFDFHANNLRKVTIVGFFGDEAVLSIVDDFGRQDRGSGKAGAALVSVEGTNIKQVIMRINTGRNYVAGIGSIYLEVRD